MRKVKLRSAVSPGQRTCSHVISNTGCHPKCRIRTTPSPITFTRDDSGWLLLISQTEEVHERMQIYWRRRCYLHKKWLAGRARSTILLQLNSSFGETQDQVHFSCRRWCWKVTKYDNFILWLSVTLRTYWMTLVDLATQLGYQWHILYASD